MRRLMWGMIFLCLGLAPSASAALAGGTRVRVRPARGGIHTDFVLRFSIPAATGRSEGIDISDSVSVAGKARPGCIGQSVVPLRSAAAGTPFRIALNPRRLHGVWCRGRFTGSLVQRLTTVCPIGTQLIICPQYVVAPRVLARFHFTVIPPRNTGAAR